MPVFLVVCLFGGNCRVLLFSFFWRGKQNLGTDVIGSGSLGLLVHRR